MAPSRLEPEGKFQSESGVRDFETLPSKYGWPTENAAGYRIKEQLFGNERPIRVIHLGAGASGICFAKLAAETLNNVSFTCYDKNSEIGGTWLENRYSHFPLEHVFQYWTVLEISRAVDNRSCHIVFQLS
jgi:hypothetical protein